MKKCSIEGCENTNIASKEKGWCWKHYRRWLRTGDTSDPTYANKGKQCVIQGCEEQAKTRGYCTKHLNRVYAHDNPNTVKKVASHNGEICMVKGCDKPVQSLILCKNHYYNYYHYKKKDVVDTAMDYVRFKNANI